MWRRFNRLPETPRNGSRLAVFNEDPIYGSEVFIGHLSPSPRNSQDVFFLRTMKPGNSNRTELYVFPSSAYVMLNSDLVNALTAQDDEDA
jgi:hypothetical protein